MIRTGWFESWLAGDWAGFRGSRRRTAPPAQGPRESEWGPHLFGITDRGLERDTNEDTFLLTPHGLVVADGMGGENSGEVASSLTVQAMAEEMEGEAPAEERLRSAFALAQRRVLERGASDESCSGMGCAVVAALLEGSVAKIGHAGDSRAYLSRDGNMRMLTLDHSAIAERVRCHELSWEEARCHPRRSALCQAVGMTDGFRPEFQSIRLMPGDRLLLCSDGLWDELAEGEIGEVLAADGTARQLATILFHRALAAGGRDNITLVLYQHNAA
jgi:serine/threonine protein phosphatase PrpC